MEEFVEQGHHFGNTRMSDILMDSNIMPRSPILTEASGSSYVKNNYEWTAVLKGVERQSCCECPK